MLYDKRWDKQAETVTDPLTRLLVEARKMIARKSDWCQSYSENRVNKAGKPYIAICAIHALQRAWEVACPTRDNTALEAAAVDALSRAVGIRCSVGPEFGHWNDTHSHAAVLAAFDRAIERMGRPDQGG